MNKNKDYGDKLPVNSIQDRHAFGHELWLMFEPGWQDHFWQRRGHVQKRCEELGWKPPYWAGSHVKEGNNFQLAYLPINVKLWNTRLLPVQQFLSNIRSSLIPFPSWLLSRSQTYFQLRRRSKPYWKLHLEQFTLSYSGQKKPWFWFQKEYLSWYALKTHGTITVNPVWSVQNLRYQGGLVCFWSGMQRMRAKLAIS